MRRRFTLAAASTLALIFSLPAQGQDSPSLGDLARQAQKDKDKDKANKPAAKVFTNDNMPAGGAGAALGAGFEGGSSAAASPAEKLAQLDKVVDQLATVDRATLVRNVLKEKSNVDFPGRAAWEQRLFTARDTYVLQARAVIQKARQILASAESLKGSQDPNDPRVKEINAGLQAFARDAVQTDAGFAAVVNEGRDLASLPSAH